MNWCNAGSGVLGVSTERKLLLRGPSPRPFSSRDCAIPGDFVMSVNVTVNSLAHVVSYQ